MIFRTAPKKKSDFLILSDVLLKYRGPGGNVIIPDGVRRIGKRAFERSSLTSLTIPESVTSIGSFAFEGCGSLTSLTIQGSVDSIGVAAFKGCRSLSSLVIHGSVPESLGDEFRGCRILASLSLSDSAVSVTRFMTFPPYVRCHTPAAADCVPSPVYLGGSPGGLKEETLRKAARGFIYAQETGVREISRWKQDYLDYIRGHIGPFLEEAETDRQVLLFLVREELLDKDEADRFLDLYADSDDLVIRAALLDYRRRKFGQGGPDDLSL